MDEYRATIEGTVPSKSNCYRIITKAGHASLGKTKALADYERSFYLQAGALRGAGIRDLFALSVRVFYPSMSHDLDNSLKVLLDCLQGCGAIRNDNRCVSIYAEKFIDKRRPRVELTLTPLEIGVEEGQTK